MAYVYQITDLATHKGTGFLYALVSFWQTQADLDAKQPPYLVNDFIMQLSATETRIVIDKSGNYQRLDGVFVAPDQITEKDDSIGWTHETVPFDVKSAIIANIEAYAARAEAQKFAGDHTANESKPFIVDGKVIPQKPTAPIQIDKSDPNGILALPDVAALVVANAVPDMKP